VRGTKRGERGAPVGAQPLEAPGATGQLGQPPASPVASEHGDRIPSSAATYTEGLLLKAIDTIQAKSKQPPAILLQADEGFEAYEGDWGEAAVRDIRVKGISAMYLPGMPSVRPPDKLNTVNTLRFVFNRYFDAGYPLLRNASYPEGDLPYQFAEMPVRGLAEAP
jgi:hypothetical protein